MLNAVEAREQALLNSSKYIQLIEAAIEEAVLKGNFNTCVEAPRELHQNILELLRLLGYTYYHLLVISEKRSIRTQDSNEFQQFQHPATTRTIHQKKVVDLELRVCYNNCIISKEQQAQETTLYCLF